MKSVYPGSFDPITKGHLDIIERAAAVCDDLIVAVAHNVRKKSFFSVQERLELLRRVTEGIPGVKVDTFDGLLVEYMKRSGARIVIRGLRAVTDFEMEFQMALVNKKLYPPMETMFMVTSAKFMFINSTTIKEVAHFGGCVDEFVPPVVAEALYRKLNEGKFAF